MNNINNMHTCYLYCILYTVYMPNKTVYIRKEDLDLWDNLKDKSEAIHNLLVSAATLTPEVKQTPAEPTLRPTSITNPTNPTPPPTPITYKPTSNWGA